MSKKYNDAGLASASPLTGAEQWGVARSGADKYVTTAMIATYIGQGLIALARTNGSEGTTNPGEDKLQFNNRDYGNSTITTGASWKFTAPATATYLIAIMHLLIVPGSGMNYTAGDQIKVLRYSPGVSGKVIYQQTKGITETQNEPYNTIPSLLDIVSLTAADELSYNIYRSVSDGTPTIASDATIAIMRVTT